jgi:glycosyltransferase involved in cell wall biosynthesis
MVRSFIMRYGVRAFPPARAAVRNAALVLATNRDTERLARRLGGKSVRRLSDTAVPPELFARRGSIQSSDGSLIILWLARLYPIKGLPLALDALARIPPETSWACKIVGNGPLAGQVPRWLRRRGIEDRTTWVGEVPWNDIGTVFEQAHVFLFTSLRDSSGAQLYEAAAFGLPIIALDHHGVTDLIPDDVAIKVALRDGGHTAQGIADAIELLARDTGARRSMAEASLRFARRNTWGARVNEAYSMIEAAIAEWPGHPPSPAS